MPTIGRIEERGSAEPGLTENPKGKGKALKPPPSSDSSDDDRRRDVKRGRAAVHGSEEDVLNSSRSEAVRGSASTNSLDMTPLKWRRLKK